MFNQMKFYIYDLETLINCFVFSGKFYKDPKVQTFEMSSRKNQRSELLNWLSYLQNSGVYMVGFNNLGFDYPITHELLNNPYTFDFTAAYNLCQQIIGSQRFGGNDNSVTISLRDRIISQIDLYRINHFNNANKGTSLKALEFAMRMQNVEDMPVAHGVPLTFEQMDQVISYNHNDLFATEEFLTRNLHLIEMRKELLDSGVLSGDVLNFSDVKIGGEYLIKKIGRTKCFSGSKPRQTFRPQVEFSEAILPKIFYRTEPFNEVLEWFKKQIFYVGGDNEIKLQKTLAGLEFHFGVGGVHASVESKKYESNETHIIKDVDVSGMYVSIANVNEFAPEHLGKEFTLAYRQLKSDRDQYKKGTTMNKTLKLAGNGAFGNSDNRYSCFYDPKYPKQITVNGQLQLLQLVELFSLIPGLEIIQANTDGVTCYLPRTMEPLFNLWKCEWERMTALDLEMVDYSKMWIRDVNNYLCIDVKGKVKAKGAYWWPKEDSDYEGNWNKDFSMMVVAKVAEQILINGWDAAKTLKCMTDPFDFMLRYKTPAGAKVYLGDKEMPKTIRYYVSTQGQPMKKIASPKGVIGEFKRKNGLKDEYFDKIKSEIPPGSWDERIHTANKQKYEQVTTSIEAGRLIKECNIASKFDWNDVDWGYYLQEIEKLKIGV